jgi:steroid 5-alpha reductase family enzyme
MPLVSILLVNAALSAACFVALWLISLRLKDVSFIDSWWAFGIVVLAVATALQWPGSSPHGLWLLGLTIAWGLRLGLYLLWRWRKNGPDHRYQAILGRAQTKQGWSFAKASLLMVFALQAPLQFIVSLPVQLGQIGQTQEPLGAVAWTGVALAALGILFESIGDWQLVRFKRDPKNRGKVLANGLWRYTRHPNYFGDALVWWGLFLIAAETPFGLWSLPSPILITALLTRWSGVPTVEGSMRKKRPDYEDYIRRTPGFIPWFPKRSV